MAHPPARFPHLLAPLCVLALALCTIGSAQSDGSYSERFDLAWRLVDERYWDLTASGIDWGRIGEKYREQALAAEDEAAFYRVLELMYQELGDNHSVFVPPARVSEIRESYGDLPCIGVFGFAAEEGSLGNVDYRMIGETGYIRVPDLASPGVAGNVRQSVRRLAASDAQALVLDLRGNPGGRLVEMMQVAGVFTRGFLWRTITRWTLPLPYPAIGGVETELPLAVLIDGEVNSAAEGLAGALQQSGRAVVVGEPSAGNVEAVLPFCLRDGSQAWIATGVLAPIGGPSWEGRGVQPDLAVPAAGALEAALRHLGRE